LLFRVKNLLGVVDIQQMFLHLGNLLSLRRGIAFELGELNITGFNLLLRAKLFLFDLVRARRMVLNLCFELDNFPIERQRRLCLVGFF
jgi:hypothetical protein